MKLGQITNPSFLVALSDLMDKNLPPAIAFRLRGVVKSVQEEIKKFEELRKKYLEELADKDEKGALFNDEKGYAKFSDKEKEKEMVKRVEELVAVEVTFPTVKIEELGTKVEISTKTVLALDGLLVE